MMRCDSRRGRAGRHAHLSDILVADSADLLDVGSALGDLLEVVTGELQLVLDVLGSLDLDTVGHNDTANELLAQEVSDLNLHAASLVVLLEVDVDGEMGVDVAHLVLVALGDTNDHVVDDGADGAESGDVLAGTVVHLDVDDVLLGVREADSQVLERLLENATGAGDGDMSGLDLDLDCVGVSPKRSFLYVLLGLCLGRQQTGVAQTYHRRGW